MSTGSGWIDERGNHYPMKKGETHAQAAHAIRMNEDLGTSGLGMAQTLHHDTHTGDIVQKGKSGEHAKADIEKKLGDPNSEEHVQYLCNKGWVMASFDGDMRVFRSSAMDHLRGPWKSIRRLAAGVDSVVFVVTSKIGGVSAGLYSKDLPDSVDGLIERIAGATKAKVLNDWKPKGNGILYFE